MAGPLYNSRLNQDPITRAGALTEDTAIDAAACGRSIMITASVAGTVTLTLFDGSTIVVNPAVGDNIYPFAVRKATKGTATITAYYNLY